MHVRLDDTLADPHGAKDCVNAGTVRSKASRFRWTGAFVIATLVLTVGAWGVSGQDSQEVQAVAASGGSNTRSATGVSDVSQASPMSLQKTDQTIKLVNATPPGYGPPGGGCISN